jgi:predicted nucleic acid-binding protein
MATLIDSSVLIAAERGQLNFDEFAARYADDDMAISAVTASELLHGLYRARTATQRHRRQSFVEGLLAQLPVIAFDLMVARIHASLWADLARRGIAVGERDLMIGATGVAKDYSVATRDERSFPKISGLKVQRIWV